MYLTLDVAFPLYFVNSLRLRLPSLSFFVILLLDVSFVFLSRNFSFLCHCTVFPLSHSHSISSILSDLDSFLPDFICLPLVVSLSYVSPFLSLSFSVVLSVTFLLSYCLSLVHCISSILFDFVCSVCRSLSFSR